MPDYTYLDGFSDSELAEFKQVDEALVPELAQKGLKALASGESLDLGMLDATTLAKLFAPFRREIVAEGDSWFDYLPGTDLIDCLRRIHGFRIQNHARAGDRLERMIYGHGVSAGGASIAAVLHSVERHKPKCLLFSGGGNDVAGEGFGAYLNHATSNEPPLRREILDHMVNKVFRNALIHLCDRIGEVSPETKVVMHGYGYAMPTGEGVRMFGWNFIGPWLKPALDEKGLTKTQGTQIVREIIDAYNAMLGGLDGEVARFHYVDLRPHLNPASDFRDELHPRNSAFARCSDVIAARLKELGAG